MIERARNTYRGINRDTTKSKQSPEFYYDAKNIVIVNSNAESTGSITNELGNRLIISIPDPCIDVDNKVITYGDKVLEFTTDEISDQINTDSECENSLGQCSGKQVIIGNTVTRDSVIVATTDSKGFDCIWEVSNIMEDSNELTLLYVRSMGLSIDHPVQILFNFENDKIQKIYLVDGNNQMKHFNIKHSIANGDLEELIDIPVSNIDQVSDFELSQVKIVDVLGGSTHTSGMIQYTYNLYKTNGSQTSLSPISELIPLDKSTSGEGGGELNEVVGASPKLVIPTIDTDFTNIKVYSIKYTSYNERPEVNIIVDEEIDAFTNYTYIDNGSSLGSISLEELVFIGGNPTIPSHIETKDNRLYSFNLKDIVMDFKIDTRAYSFSNELESIVYDSIAPVETSSGTFTLNPEDITIINSEYEVPEKYDAVNPNYDIYKFQKDGETLGGEGKYIKFQIKLKSKEELEEEGDSTDTVRVFKNGELYRIGIKFYNILGQATTAYWICDYKMPMYTNLQGQYTTLRVDIQQELYDYIDTLCLTGKDRPVGYKVLVAERTILDKSIYTQGCMQGMFVQTTKDVTSTEHYRDNDPLGFSNVREDESEDLLKTPMLRSREFGKFSNYPLYGYKHTRMVNDNFELDGLDVERQQEIFTDRRSEGKRQQSWQYLRMMQMYTPEVVFGLSEPFPIGTKMRVLGLTDLSYTMSVMKRQDVSTLGITHELYVGTVNGPLFNDGYVSISNKGFWVGPSDGDMRFIAHSKSYREFTPSNNLINYSVYGKPEVTELGQGPRTYYNDSKFRYTNNLKGVISDENIEAKVDDIDDNMHTINSDGTRCVTIVEGELNVPDIRNRKSLDELYEDTGLDRPDSILMAELAAPPVYIYRGNMYGGTTYEAKTRTSYLEVGDYVSVDNSFVEINNPGDTFVQVFKFTRLQKTDIQVIDKQANQITDFLEFPVETTIDLVNRNDLSKKNWDTKFQPKFEEYHEYNRVYSQLPTLFKTSALLFNYKVIKDFDTRVRASKQKVPGESLDSFTDPLENEVLDLDGKYGAINGTVNVDDEIFALQDSAIAHMVINPRAQVQAEDGISIELGKGGILYDYDYITTSSGTINKWSIANSPSGFYYLDALNKGWYKAQGRAVINLSDKFGLHAFFENTIDYAGIKPDNPLLNVGVSAGFNNNNLTSYLTVATKRNTFTLDFNEASNSFVSFHDYTPSMYINKGDKMLTLSPDNGSIYSHEEGDYQTYYGIKYPTYVTILVNPAADMDCVFTNIMYKSEIYLDDIDQSDKSLTHISAYNEYQDSGRVPLILGRSKNLRRKFRNWKAIIPRNKDTRERIRNPWVYLKLELDTESNYKMILHDIVVNYTV